MENSKAEISKAEIPVVTEKLYCTSNELDKVSEKLVERLVPYGHSISQPNVEKGKEANELTTTYGAELANLNKCLVKVVARLGDLLRRLEL